MLLYNCVTVIAFMENGSVARQPIVNYRSHKAALLLQTPLGGVFSLTVLEAFGARFKFQESQKLVFLR